MKKLVFFMIKIQMCILHSPLGRSYIKQCSTNFNAFGKKIGHYIESTIIPYHIYSTYCNEMLRKYEFLI